MTLSSAAASSINGSRTSSDPCSLISRLELDWKIKNSAVAAMLRFWAWSCHEPSRNSITMVAVSGRLPLKLNRHVPGDPATAVPAPSTLTPEIGAIVPSASRCLITNSAGLSVMLAASRPFPKVSGKVTSMVWLAFRSLLLTRPPFSGLASSGVRSVSDQNWVEATLPNPPTSSTTLSANVSLTSPATKAPLKW